MIPHELGLWCLVSCRLTESDKSVGIHNQSKLAVVCELGVRVANEVTTPSGDFSNLAQAKTRQKRYKKFTKTVHRPTNMRLQFPYLYDYFG
jgi:hypothetical protein